MRLQGKGATRKVTVSLMLRAEGVRKEIGFTIGFFKTEGDCAGTKNDAYILEPVERASLNIRNEGGREIEGNRIVLERKRGSYSRLRRTG